MQPRFITFEGVDGAGKSTQVALFAEHLAARGIPVCRTREPGGTPLGEQIRALLLAETHPIDPLTQALMLFAARQHHIVQVIRPALAARSWVLCDRFTDSTYAYQGYGSGLDLSIIKAMETIVHADLQPDLTLYFDLDIATARSRLQGGRELDRFEHEGDAFFQRVRAGYLERAQAHPDRLCVLDASMPAAVLSKEVEETVPVDWFV